MKNDEEISVNPTICPISRTAKKRTRLIVLGTLVLLTYTFALSLLFGSVEWRDKTIGTLMGKVFPRYYVKKEAHENGRLRDLSPDEVMELTTVTGNKDIIMYNRMPKCGSTSLNNIFKNMSQANNFATYSSKTYWPWTLNETAQKNLVEELYNMGHPVMYDRHMFFFDFTVHGRQQPIWINVIRDPQERLLSAYYFIRNSMSHMFKFNPEEANYTYDQCVEYQRKECYDDTINGYFQLIPFHCGQDPRCHTSSQWALDRAKENVVKWYLVVGISEDMITFVEILGKILPEYFRNVANVYIDQEEKLKAIWGVTKKVVPSEKTIQIMREKLKYEYDFYEWIKQRLYQQHKLVVGY